MSVLTFSGHDTFHCRQLWLKKAFDYVAQKRGFNDEDSSLQLGVGRNMVTAIRYWAKQFQILDENDNPTKIAELLFKEEGWDPYLEDEGSLWLLHYLLVTKKGGADTFSIIFNELIKERPEFSSEVYTKYVFQTKDDGLNENTLKKDFTVFYKTYYAEFESNDIEESFTGILTELELLKQKPKTVIDADGKTKVKNVWLIERTVRPSLPSAILLYAILDQHESSLSISFNQLYNDLNSPGSVFAMSKEGLTIALEKLAAETQGNITFSNQAGVRELQFKKAMKSVDVLSKYYGK
jgi:hypothetical protein